MNFQDETTRLKLKKCESSESEVSDMDTFHISDVVVSTEGGEEEEEEENSISIPSADKMFIVFWSSLLTLFRFCLNCSAPASITKVKNTGVMITVFMCS